MKDCRYPEEGGEEESLLSGSHLCFAILKIMTRRHNQRQPICQGHITQATTCDQCNI